MRRSTTKLPLGALVGTFAVLLLAGCAESRLRLDPSGEHLFIYDPPPAATCPPGTVPAPVAVAPAATSGLQPIPMQPAPVVGPAPVQPIPVQPVPVRQVAAQPVTPYSDVAVTIAPCSRVAPIGAEVILVAGVRGGDGYLRTNRRLDWWLAPNSAGQFTEIGKGHFEDVLVGDFSQPRIISNASAVGTTSRVAERVGQAGSIPIVRGESWIALRSAVEGVSQVTVAAQSVVVPAERTKTATIYWYDAQYRFPEPVVTPAGTKAALTTSVWTLTSHCPRPGWIVRYELIGGPQAIFVPSGTTAVEVPTDAAGAARVEIVQKDPSPGTSQIRVQLFRPADQSAPRFLVRDSCTAVSWTGAAGAMPAPAMPALATPTLPGPITTTPPATNPPPVTTPPPGGRPAPGAIPSLPAAVSILELKVTPRSGFTVVVGSTVTFDIDVTNRGTTVATGLIIRDIFDVGLQHVSIRKGREEIDRSPIGFKDASGSPIRDLAPGALTRFVVTFRVITPGRLCNRVEAVAVDGGHAAQDSCVTAVPPESSGPAQIAPPSGPANITPPPRELGPANPLRGNSGTGASPPAALSRLSVRVDNRNIVSAGKVQQFVVQVSNDGDAAENNVLVTVRIPAGSTLVSDGTAGPGPTIKFQQQGSLVRFDPVSQLPAHRMMNYRVNITTSQPGQISLQADVTSDRQSVPISNSKSVEVLPAE